MSTFSRSDFRKSRWSDPDKNCVEVAMSTEVVEVRDSKTEFGAADDHRLRMSPAAFAALIAAVKQAPR
ncbi:DUF397 domain-containing protein [Amycolatopsis roodepoortensis]|uniref:DUF397 domain-containing protein n=1 Tax=Amycolatopsis roodepoortensis TaxID=700274 RepID=A0ABR9LJU9_9PSEU|nr:DUF397 domain-containing protein [Amycolatopsis roodepoortensis]MBE1580557.1 hypothetical protein [Amycolatopsis roodepoortensis]